MPAFKPLSHNSNVTVCVWWFLVTVYHVLIPLLKSVVDSKALLWSIGEDTRESEKVLVGIDGREQSFAEAESQTAWTWSFCAAVLFVLNSSSFDYYLSLVQVNLFAVKENIMSLVIKNFSIWRLNSRDFIFFFFFVKINFWILCLFRGYFSLGGAYLGN